MRVAAWSSPRCPSRPNAEPSPLWDREAVMVFSVELAGRTIVGLAQFVTVRVLNGSLLSPVNHVRLYRLSTASAQTYTTPPLDGCLSRVRHTAETKHSPMGVGTRAPRTRPSSSARRPGPGRAIEPPAKKGGHDFGDLEGLSHPPEMLHVEPF